MKKLNFVNDITRNIKHSDVDLHEIIILNNKRLLIPMKWKIVSFIKVENRNEKSN